MSEKVMKAKRPSKGRSFQCTGYANCNKSFTRSEHLARHRRKHTGERPFTCSLCSKNFSRLDNLRQHKQTVHACDSHENNDASGSAPSSRVAPQPQVYIPQGTEYISAKPFQSSEYQNVQNSPTFASPSLASGGSMQGKTSSISTASSSFISPPLTGSSLHHYALDVNSRSSSDSSISQGTARNSLMAFDKNGSHASAESLSFDRLREPLKFKPKHRPMRLSLMKHHSDDSRSNMPFVGVEPSLRTAPVNGSFHTAYFPEPRSAINEYHAIPFSYGQSQRPAFPPGSSYRSFFGAGTAVSPLSPLFHRSFNQVAHSSLLSYSSPSLSKYSSEKQTNGSHLPSLPSVSKLQEMPTVLPSLRLHKVKNERDLLTPVEKNEQSNGDVTSNTSNGRDQDLLNKALIKQEEIDPAHSQTHDRNRDELGEPKYTGSATDKQDQMDIQPQVKKPNIDFLISGQSNSSLSLREDSLSAIKIENI